MKVLLLEDDPDLGSAVLDGLQEQGFVVDHVTTLADMTLQLDLSRYDCLILDRLVTDGDSLDLVQSLREDGTTTPIIMLSARDRVSDRVGGIERGADDYLTKPFAFAELVVRTRALAARAHLSATPARRALDIELDTVRHRVARDGIRLSLTAKEFSALEVLMDNPGAVVTRSEFLERCWDEMHTPSSNIVDVLIGQLRRRLGSPDPIETVRGVGYRLSTDTPAR